VTDNLTGLIWLKDANCAGTLMDWDAAVDYGAALYDGCTGCGGDNGDCGLSDGSSAGDWRLPNARELHSLIHFGYYDPALPNTAGTGQCSDGDPFTNVQLWFYWSATTYARYSDSACYVSVGGGNAGWAPYKSNSYDVWPVRGPE
jgi:hypothetical protein